MGSKIIEIFNKIAYNVLSALYQPFWAAVLLAFLCELPVIFPPKEKRTK